MKLHDFGLWFLRQVPGEKATWSTTIPPDCFYSILYDGLCVGFQTLDDRVRIHTADYDRYIIKFNKKLAPEIQDYFILERRLTLDDFEVIKNPRYKGNS
jgi:hypothetical protein